MSDNYYLPSDIGIEVAFAGRSNTGKSSALNALTNQKNLARTSKTPGRTLQINLFEVTEGKRLVDLPGYGYALIPKELRIKLLRMIKLYLEQRLCLKGLVILMDIRHPLKNSDWNIIYLATLREISVLVLLTKADKLTIDTCNQQVNMVRKEMMVFNSDIQVESFSLFRKQDIYILRLKINNWFGAMVLQNIK